MQKNSLFILFFFMLGTTVELSAQIEVDQIVKGGSFYSNIGLGEPVDWSSAAAGGTLSGISYLEPGAPGVANPALWGGSNVTLASGGVNLLNYNATDRIGSSQTATFTVDRFQLQLPVIRSKLGLAVSLSPLTRSNYQVVRLLTTQVESGGTISGEQENSGTGGVNSLEAGFGWQINEHFSIGYAASLVFLSMDKRVTTRFDTTNNFSTVDFSFKTNGYGFGNRFGAAFVFRNLFRDDDGLHFGASLSLPVVLESERIQEINDPTILSDNKTITEGPGLGKGNIELPMTIAAGATYRPSALWAVSTDGVYQPWTEFNNDFGTAQRAVMADRKKIGVGVRYFPYIASAGGFSSNLKYRIGASYDTGNLLIEGQQIEALTFSAGVGILSPRSNSSLDVNLLYGIRGTHANNLVREHFWGIQLSVNLAELMFYRPRLQ